MDEQARVNEQVVRELCQCLSSRDVPGVMARLADDGKWTIVGRPDRFAFGGTSDKAGAKATLDGFLEGFSEFEFNILSLTAQDDRVAVQASSRGKGPGRKAYSNNYMMLYTLRDGKVVDVKEYFDPFEVLDYIEQVA